MKRIPRLRDLVESAKASLHIPGNGLDTPVVGKSVIET